MLPHTRTLTHRAAMMLLIRKWNLCTCFNVLELDFEICVSFHFIWKTLLLLLRSIVKFSFHLLIPLSSSNAMQDKSVPLKWFAFKRISLVFYIHIDISQHLSIRLSFDFSIALDFFVLFWVIIMMMLMLSSDDFFSLIIFWKNCLRVLSLINDTNRINDKIISWKRKMLQ